MQYDRDKMKHKKDANIMKLWPGMPVCHATLAFGEFHVLAIPHEPQ
jgi:hypothetical protein